MILHTPHSSQLRLEEQQRARRHKREAAATKAAQAVANGNHEEAARFEKEATYTPRWFKKEFDPLTQTMMHVYKGGYWEAKLEETGVVCQISSDSCVLPLILYASIKLSIITHIYTIAQ